MAHAQDLSARVDAVIRNNRNISKQFLLAPENADVVARLRQRALGPSHDARSTLLLLRIDDPETVRYCIENLIREQSIAGDFVLSRNPRLISALGGPLFKEESAKYGKLVSGHESFAVFPGSVIAARAIQELIKSSASFNPEVTDWASKVRFETKDGEEGRQKIRDWVTLNKQVLEAEDFAAAKVPE